jgi:hypothetical protein
MTDDNGAKGPLMITFHPQEWVDTSAKSHESGRKQLIPAEERDPVTFTIPWEDGTDSDGTVFENDSYEANLLRDHPAAPAWVNDWEGPYFVTTEAQ